MRRLSWVEFASSSAYPPPLPVDPREAERVGAKWEPLRHLGDRGIEGQRDQELGKETDGTHWGRCRWE